MKVLNPNKSCFKWLFVNSVLLAAFFVVVSASSSDANPRYAVAAEQARRAAAGQATANVGGESARADLRAIAAPRTQPQTATGLPAGVLPGDTLGAGNDGPVLRTVLSGEPLPSAIGFEFIGERLDRISVIAGHVGYNLVRGGFNPAVLDTPYTFALMRGNRRVSTLYFNRSMTLMAIR